MADAELEALKQTAKKGRARKTATAKAEPVSTEIVTEEHGRAEPDQNPRLSSRPTRAETTRRERRMRDSDIATGLRQNLKVPPQVIEDARRRGMRLRWVKDDPMRMQQMHDADWDPVVDANGSHITRAAGRTEETKQILVEKPEEWVQEEKAARARERMNQLSDKMAGDNDPDALVGYSRGNNSITRGNR